MRYLVILLLTGSLMAAFGVLSAVDAGRERKPRLAPIALLLGVVMLCLGAMSAYSTPLASPPRSAMSANWSVWYLFIGAGLGLAGFLYALAAERERLWNRSLRVATLIWSVLGCIYVAGTCVDHWIFFADRDRNAVIYSVQQLGVGDVVCGGALLARTDGQIADVRCAESVVLGGLLSPQPFVPWPEYTASSSVELVPALQRTLAIRRARAP